MDDRERIDREVQAFFEKLWSQGDFWQFEADEYEQNRYARLVRLLEGRRYGRALEVGCGAGAFTRYLAPLAARVVASDVAAAAIERARASAPANVEFRVANVIDKSWHADGPWDLIVFNDTIHYLGWRYTFFEVAWLAFQLFEATASGGRLLMANTMNAAGDYLLLPFVVRSYRDLFLNVGFRIEKEESFKGTKNGTEYEVLASLFTR